MAVAVRVRAKVTGHRRRGEQDRDLALALPPGPVTARQIIEAAVAAEVAAYHARAGEASLVRVLTDQALLDDLDRGAVRMGDAGPAGLPASAGPADPAAAVQTALLAFDQILATILDHKLLRFGAAVRAAGVWLGFGASVADISQAEARVGVENLARTAGYADPRRFVWAAEAREVADLAAGPVTVSRGDVTLSLSVTGDGIPDLTVRRGQRVLKAVPAALRQDGDVVALRARQAALTQQAARVREALEAAMIAQDTFTDDDFAELSGHPLVAPMLPFADDDPKTAEIMSKVLLLARDREIKDPQILEQLR